jgi:lycopene beta-cyclase
VTSTAQREPVIDLALVGGGLANALIAYRLAVMRPEIKVVVFEREATLGGNHTWSFHGTDLTDAQRQWMAPLIAAQWHGYDVRFPGRTRRLHTHYYSISAAVFARHIGARLADRVRTGVAVSGFDAGSVTLASGERILAKAVIDGRGDPSGLDLVLGYQKFVGLEVRLAAAHGLARPILMDATVAQLDGFRFLYTLPFAPDRLLIEDTRYSDTRALDPDSYRAEIASYAQAQGWKIAAVEREEEGVLPVALGGDPLAHWPDDPRIGRAGMSAGLFHPTTGYTLAAAVQLADAIAALPTIDAGSVHALTRRIAAQHWRTGAMFRLLNRMLFRAARPTERYRVLERFYGLSAPLIQRFYAGHLTLGDKLRLLIGRPPVPIWAAIKCARESSLVLPASGRVFT